jgi:hypothetical protein
VLDYAELLDAPPRLVAGTRSDGTHVGPLSAAALEYFTCDCSVSRIVMRGPSEVLDVGRATRTISAALWKALVARDGGCKVPGCGRPPAWCEAHHIVHWAQGGLTNLDNLSS